MQVLSFFESVVWNPALPLLILATGLFFSLRSRFLQIRHFKQMILLLFRGRGSKEGIAPFQAFSMALCGRIGMGNIAGVATAILVGGPGAIFWMWLAAFLGAGTAFVESVLGQLYKKVEKDGNYRGGPAYFIEKGLGLKWLGAVFAVVSIIAMFLLLPGLQANMIVSGLNEAFGLPPMIGGLIIVVGLAAILMGGVKRLAAVVGVIIPFMALGYMLVIAIILIMKIDQIPAVFSLIISSAFGAGPVFGGIVGSAIMYGIRRGIFSNEAGQGSGPHTAAAAESNHPAVQGFVQGFSVYVDTLLINSATAFAIIITGVYNVRKPGLESFTTEADFLKVGAPLTTDGPGFTQLAVDNLLPGFGSGFVAIALFLFAFACILSYYYMSETNILYLLRDRGAKNIKQIFIPLQIVFFAITFMGSVLTADVAWGFGDIGVGMMAWVNLISLWLLQRPAFRILKDYETQLKMNPDGIAFDPRPLGIKNATYWEERFDSGVDKKGKK